MEDVRTTELHVVEGTLRHEFHRSRLKANCVAWNPVHHDLFAYSPQKDHVVLKRKGQTYPCWKSSINSMARAFFFVAPNSYTIKHLVWSPDGDVLCLATDQGEIFLLDTECGHLLFAWKVIPVDEQDKTVVNVKWEAGKNYSKNGEPCRFRGGLLGDDLDWIPEKQAVKSLEERSRRKIIEGFEFLKVFNRSMRNSFLLIQLNDFSVIVLSGGVMQIAVVQPPQEFFDSHQLYLADVEDFTLIQGTSSSENGYTMVFTCFSQGFPPACSFGQKYGYPLQESTAEKPEPTSISHLLGVALDTNRIAEEQLEKLGFSFVRIYIFYYTLLEVYHSFHAGWDHELEKLNSKFNHGDAEFVRFGEELLGALYLGLDSKSQLFFERAFGAPTTKEFVDLLEKRLQKLLGWLPSALIPFSEAVMCESTAFVQIMENILASAKKPNPRDFFVSLANSIYSPERSSIPQPSVDPREEWAARLVDASENLVVSTRNLHNACKQNCDDIEMVIGVIVRYSFRDIHNLLSLEPCLSDLTGRGTKLQKMAQHCLLSYSAYDPLDAAESLLRLFFKPEEAARLRIDPTAAELPSAQLSCLPFVEGKACPVTSEQLPPREAVDLNHLSGYLSEDASTSIYGDTSLPTVKAAVDLTANTLIFAQSTVLSKKFNAHKVDWIHEIARGTDLVFGREGMKLLKISRRGERDELRICAIQKGRRAIFSSKVWKGEEKPSKPDVVIEFGKENLDITTRSDAADEPTLILGIDMFVPTEKGAVVSVQIGPRVGTVSERRLCHLDFDAGRLTTYSSQRLDESTETLAACTKGCGNCLLIADQGHRFCVTELPTKIPEVAEPVDEPM